MTDTNVEAGRSSLSGDPDAAEPARALPTSRAELLELHRAARQRRNEAALGSEAYEHAVLEIAEIEVAIASAETGVPPSRIR